MPLIFYVVISGFIFAAGQIMAPKQTITMIKDGDTQAAKVVSSDIVVMVNKDSVELLEAKKPEHFEEKSSMFPFRKDSFGDWTVDCKEDCN